MKKRLYRVLITLTMVASLFCSACSSGGNDTASEEPSSEVEESTEESKEAEETASEDIKEEKVEDGKYKISPAFIKTFELEDNILKVETEDVFEDYEMPNEMAINFEFPLSDEVVWNDSVAKITDTEDFNWYEWFTFYLEGITKAVERYNDGQYEGTYTSGEDFCEKNAIWTFVIKDEIVQSISMDLVESDVIEETTDVKEENTDEANNDTKETNASTTSPSAKEDKTASNPAPTAPTHTHSYTSSVTKQPTCGSNGTKTYTCSCGDSYTESISGGDHSWTPIYSTVEHPSMGEMRQVQTGTTGDVWICKVCGAEFNSDAAHVDHCRSFVGVDREHATATYFIRSGEPTYTNEWVVTQEAWTENVVTGYQCTTCGATK